ncbi:MAG: histidine kinase [Oscillospiraceae bacterium]|nr:histidine kinase [Oscillospiraceae bacterium]
MTGKIIRSLFSLAMLVLVIGAALFSGILYGYYEKQSFASLAQEAEQLQQTMEYVSPEQMRSADRITLISPDGTVLYDSVARADAMENHLSREEVAQALREGTGKSSHYSSTVLKKNLYYALRLEDGNVLRLSREQSSLGAMLLNMAWPIAATVAGLLLLAAGLSVRLARQITQPINAISPDDPQDVYPELQPLTQRLRQQRETIRNQMDELSRRMREFSAMTENMSEGFLLIDLRGHVLTENHSASMLLPTDADNIAKCSQRELCQAAQQALTGQRCERLLQQGERTLSVIASPVLESGQVTGAVVLTLDVTEREQREKLRREFSANVSHELKTPLTSISGFAELMSQGLVPPDKVREFSLDIQKECTRLTNLVEDIIDLSRLEEGGGDMTWEDIDLYTLCDDVLQSLEPVAKRQTVTLRLAGESLQVRGVYQVLREMIYNLCDNAIKYNRSGGSVTVTAARSAGRASVTVADTGIGIPYEDQSRVFERFYRVDKSHSRAIGGTGLGLSIVKHAAALHGAEIKLQSQPEDGTVITVLFPGE